MITDLTSVQLETTNICNAHCIFCPHDKFKEFGVMEDSLYEKIILELAELPNLRTFIPMLTGEPFTDKDIISRIKFAREKLPKTRLELYTNGSLVTKEHIQELKEIADLHINISFNGLTPESRYKMMKLDDFWKVYRTIQDMDSAGLGYRVSIVAHPAIQEKEMNEFVRDGGIAIQYQSWCGEMYPYERKRWTSCHRAMSSMSINYKGIVSLCCFDPFAKVNFGDLHTEKVQDIWESQKRQEYIIKHKAGKGNDLLMCQNCTEG